MLCLFSLTFRRAFVPTLARLHGRPSGFSWQVFSPLFSSFGRCEGWLGWMRCRRDQRNHHWGQKVASVPEMEQPKEKKSQKTLLRHNNLCVCVCHQPSLLRIESWTVHRSSECIILMPLSELAVHVNMAEAVVNGRLDKKFWVYLFFIRWSVTAVLFLAPTVLWSFLLELLSW